jgi:hypothetical protein
MIPPELEQWLKNSVAGIILLGAIGSLLAVAIGRILLALATRVLPAPLRAHRKQSAKQAYFMGFMHATIHHDKSGRLILALLSFRLARFVAALSLLLFAAILGSNVLVFQAQIVLTVGVFASVVVAFLALYWAYYEFEYVYRTYLWLWRSALESAEEGYLERDNSEAEGEAPARRDIGDEN